MIIASVQADVLTARPERGVRFSIGDYDEFSLVLVTVRTEDGTTGHGEAIARRGPAMTAAAVTDLLAPTLIGEDARNIGGLWLAMFDRLRRWGHAGSTSYEMAALTRRYGDGARADDFERSPTLLTTTMA